MATRTVTSTILRSDGSAWNGAVVKFRLAANAYTTSPPDTYPAQTVTAIANASGQISVTLAADLAVAYVVTLPDGDTFNIFVPAGSPTTIEALRAAYSGASPTAPPDLTSAIVSIIDDPATQVGIDHDHIGNNGGVGSHAALAAHLAASSDVHGVSGSVVGTTGAQTLQSKTLGSGTKIAVGSDATGDLHYRDSSGNLVRLPIGTTGQALIVNSGLPAWGTGGGGSSSLAGDTDVAITSPASGDIIVYNAGTAKWVNTPNTGGGGIGTGSLAGAVEITVGDPGGSVITAGTKAYLYIPFDCTLTAWNLTAGVSTTTTLDVWKRASASGLPTDTQRIAGTDKPRLAAATFARSSLLSGWTTSVSAGDLIGVEVESNDSAKYLALGLEFSRAGSFTSTDAINAVGGALLDSTSIDFTFAGGTITAVAKYAGAGGDLGAAATLAHSDHAHDARYAALAHTHLHDDISDWTEAVQDTVGALVVDSSTIDATYDDVAGTLGLAVIPNTVNQKIAVYKDGALVGTRRAVNFITGAGVSYTAVDNGTDDRIDLTIASSGGGGGGGSLDVYNAGALVVSTATRIDFSAAFVASDLGSFHASVAANFGTTAGSIAEGSHVHDATGATITNLSEVVGDAVGALVASSTSIAATYNDAGNAESLDVIYGGSGGNSGTAATAARFDHNHDISTLLNALEFIQDAMNSTAVAGVALTKTYDDTLGTLTWDVQLGTAATQAAAGNHTHVSTAITDFAEAVDDRVGALLVDSTSIDVTYNDAGNAETINVNFGGTGSASTAARSDHTHSGVVSAIKWEVGDPTGSVIIANSGVARGFISIPFPCTITGWRLLADASGSIVLDVWKAAYASFPPTNANSIAGTEKPTLASQQKNEDTALSTWTTSLSAGDVLAVEIESASTVKWVELTLNLTRTI